MQKEVTSRGGRPRDTTVSYQSQCDAFYASKLIVRVMESRDEDHDSHHIIAGGQMIHRGIKRKRTETESTVD